MLEAPQLLQEEPQVSGAGLMEAGKRLRNRELQSLGSPVPVIGE